MPPAAIWTEKVCPKCAGRFMVKPSHVDRRTFCSRRCAKLDRPSNWAGHSPSPETRAKMRAAKLGIRGEAHWNYRGGGVQTERHRLMQQDEYKQWRLAVFERDDYTCQHCGQRGGTLQADHISPWATHPSLRYVVANGRTLCVPCHRATPTWGGATKTPLWYTAKGKPVYAMMGGADDVTIPTTGTGSATPVVATDQVGGGQHYQRFKLTDGTADSTTHINSGVGTPVNGLRVVEATAATSTLANVAASATSVTLQASNANRLGWTCVNDSTAVLYIKCGATASTTSFTAKLSAGAYWECPYRYTGVIDGIWASATGSARVDEFTA